MSQSASPDETPLRVRRREKLKKATVHALNHAYSIAADAADERIDQESRTGVAAGVAASLLSLGIDKINGETVESVSAKAAAELKTDSPGFFSLNSAENDSMEKDITYEDSTDSALNSRRSSVSGTSAQDHFIDKLLEKLLLHAIPHKDRENLSAKLYDPERTRKPNLSIRIMVKNFRKLSARLNGIFVIQYAVAHVLSWRKPTITLTFLVLYSYVCLYPHLILVYPLLYVLYGIMAPSYMYRHPLSRPAIRKVRKRGKSVFDFLIGSEHLSEVAKKIFPEPEPPLNVANVELFEKEIAASSVKKDVDEDTAAGAAKSSKRNLQKQMELMTNMRDLQNLTTDVINVYDAAERFWYGTGGFSDERVSTSLFISILCVVIIVLLFGSYIPWRAIILMSGWAVTISCHPKSAIVLKKFDAIYLKPQKVKIDKTIKKAEIKDIILDEAPDVQEVEVFELEEQGWTPSQWATNCFTSTMFGGPDQQKQQLPSGCLMLNEVLPPRSWKFDEETPWKVDCRAEWAHGRTDMKQIGEDGWVYDIENKSIGRWRRRRLTRNCFRYARPARVPLK